MWLGFDVFSSRLVSKLFKDLHVVDLVLLLILDKDFVVVEFLAAIADSDSAAVELHLASFAVIDFKFEFQKKR